ncbi:sugar ABC transporter permease [Spirochaetia bacterium]|nr:sugar ABC transporter permease [Spirochaetia bacterium]
MNIKRMIKRSGPEGVAFSTLNICFLLIFSALMIYPILNTLAISFNDGTDTIKGGIHLLPRVFSLQNYRVVFNSSILYQAFFNSVLKTVILVVTNIFFTAMLAYTLARKDFSLNKVITIVFVFTMYFNPGLIPGYLLIKNLRLLNTFTVYWLPGIVSAFNLIVIRTYIKTIPESLIESAKMDGGGDFLIFIRIILPLTIPAISTIALFVAVGSWNSWFDTLIYNSSNIKLTTLQYELQKLLSSAMSMSASTQQSVGAEGLVGRQVTPMSIRAAITVVTAVPILIVYPFLQRYFVTGLTVGGVKE